MTYFTLTACGVFRRNVSPALRSLLVILAIACLIATLPCDTQAATVYSTGFDGPVGTTPGTVGTSLEDWVGTGFALNGSSKYVASTSNAISTYTPYVFSNGIVEADLNLLSFTGVVARVNGGDFYHARLRDNASGDTLEIYRFGGTAVPLASVAAPGYDSGETWKIRMAVQDSAIVASLYDQTGAQVATTTAYDTNYSSGVTGVRGNSGSTWDAFAIDDEVPLFNITTADGNGADSYVEYRSDQTSAANANYGTSTTVQTKNAGPNPEGNSYPVGAELSRKTYLRFDLNSLGEEEFQAVLLKMSVTGADGTNNTFNVYGLNESEGADGWGETAITWNNAPANDDSLGAVDLAQATFLGDFEGAVAGTTLTFGSQELHDFIAADTDKLVTLIITRANNDPNFASASHSFYSKEAGDLALAPTLAFVTPLPVPEPSTLVLLGMGVVGLLSLAVRRRFGSE